MSVTLSILLISLYGFLKCFYCGDLRPAAMTPDKFGKVIPKVTGMYFCKGPKRENCTELGINTNSDFTEVSLSVITTKKTDISKIKMSIWAIKNVTTDPDIVKWIDHPCNHFLLGPIIKTHLKMNQNCELLKSEVVANLNVKKLVNDLLGLQFFYGAYRSKTIVTGKNCNIACVISEFYLGNANNAKQRN